MMTKLPKVMKRVRNMKTLMKKASLVVVSALFFTLIGPIIVTTAKHHLFSIGFGLLFLFFGACLYLVLTSTFFNSEEAERDAAGTGSEMVESIGSVKTPEPV